ncbi:DUF2141 domain-containing protein [Ancylomarina sp. YFZ004]
MKTLLLTVTICLLYVSSMFAQENIKSIRVNVSGLDSNQGKVMVVLYSNADNFLKEACLSKDALIQDNKAFVSFENIQAGIYAIMCFHDENDNNKLDLNAKGRPIESVGVSNNAKGFFGPPKFKDAKFLIQDTDLVQNIEF